MNVALYWSLIVAGLVGLLAAFGVREYIAIKGHRRADTFTVWIRRSLGIEPPRDHRLWASAVFAFVLITFTVWFVPHIVFGWWGGCC